MQGACTCQLIYVPLVASPILPNLFTLPTHSSLFPLLPTDVHLLMTRHKVSNGDDGVAMMMMMMMIVVMVMMMMMMMMMMIVMMMLSVAMLIFDLIN